MFVFVDRRERDDRFLAWKVRLFTLAAVLALVGIGLRVRWLTGLAIGVLAAAMLLRFLPGGGIAEPEADGAWDDEAWDDEAWDDEAWDAEEEGETA